MKELFEKYPLIQYDIDGSGNTRTVIDILQRVKIRDVLKNDYLVFYTYQVKDGETPEIIAHKLYGSTQYHWIVLYCNDIVDPYYDWPMSGDNLIATIRKKYRTPERDGLEYAYQTIHHYEDLNGYVIDETTFKSLPLAERKQVSLYDWETSENERKRTIRLLDKRFLSQIDAEMENLMKRTLV
jgi:hypothetical protein